MAADSCGYDGPPSVGLGVTLVVHSVPAVGVPPVRKMRGGGGAWGAAPLLDAEGNELAAAEGAEGAEGAEEKPEKNWVDLEMLDAEGKGIVATYEVFDKNSGAMIATGKLDAEGKGHTELPEDKTSLEARFKLGTPYEPKRVPQKIAATFDDKAEMKAKAEQLAQLTELKLA
ncbi:MAG: hypothetical protein JRH20_18420 [Deltaproteobacteria bacterium]|nr:hypothetical protein [Deltaproteobacteria bacterium]